MKGIVGIVASRLIETYYRPTVVLTMSNGFVDGFGPLGAGLRPLSGRRVVLGPAGELRRAHVRRRAHDASRTVEEFTRRFNAYVEENIDPQMLIPQVEIDSELLFSNITPAFRRDLNRFQPFGPGNPAPVFATRGVSNHGDAKLVGAECEHLRMDLMQRQKPNTTIQYDRLPAADPLRVDPRGTSDRRLLSDRREPLPGLGFGTAPHQGHQTPAEQAIIRPATSVKTGAFRLRFFTDPARRHRRRHSVRTTPSRSRNEKIRYNKVGF